MRFAALACCTLACCTLVGIGVASGAHPLVEDLRSDGARFNAIKGARALGTMLDPPLGDLHAALDSDDWQQRQIAARLLWSFATPNAWAGRPALTDVSDRMIEVAMEGLRSDLPRLDPYNPRGSGTRHVEALFRALRTHARRARPWLERGLTGEDPQVRVVSALALGYGGVSESARLVAPVLIPHLRDNSIREDAKWSVGALYRLGPEVIPHLQDAMPTADRQQRNMLELLILDLTVPLDTPRVRAERRRLNTVTSVVEDPAKEWVGQSGFGWLRALPARPGP